MKTYARSALCLLFANDVVRDETMSRYAHENAVRAKLLVRSCNSLIMIMMFLLRALGGDCERAGARTLLY